MAYDSGDVETRKSTSPYYKPPAKKPPATKTPQQSSYPTGSPQSRTTTTYTPSGTTQAKQQVRTTPSGSSVSSSWGKVPYYGQRKEITSALDRLQLMREKLGSDNQVYTQAFGEFIQDYYDIAEEDYRTRTERQQQNWYQYSNDSGNAAFKGDTEWFGENPAPSRAPVKAKMPFKPVQIDKMYTDAVNGGADAEELGNILYNNYTGVMKHADKMTAMQREQRNKYEEFIKDISYDPQNAIDQAKIKETLGGGGSSSNSTDADTVDPYTYSPEGGISIPGAGSEPVRVYGQGDKTVPASEYTDAYWEENVKPNLPKWANQSYLQNLAGKIERGEDITDYEKSFLPPSYFASKGLAESAEGALSRLQGQEDDSYSYLLDDEHTPEQDKQTLADLSKFALEMQAQDPDSKWYKRTSDILKWFNGDTYDANVWDSDSFGGDVGKYLKFTGVDSKDFGDLSHTVEERIRPEWETEYTLAYQSGDMDKVRELEAERDAAQNEVYNPEQYLQGQFNDMKSWLAAEDIHLTMNDIVAAGGDFNAALKVRFDAMQESQKSGITKAIEGAFETAAMPVVKTWDGVSWVLDQGQRVPQAISAGARYRADMLHQRGEEMDDTTAITDPETGEIIQAKLTPDPMDVSWNAESAWDAFMRQGDFTDEAYRTEGLGNIINKIKASTGQEEMGGFQTGAVNIANEVIADPINYIGFGAGAAKTGITTGAKFNELEDAWNFSSDFAKNVGIDAETFNTSGLTAKHLPEMINDQDYIFSMYTGGRYKRSVSKRGKVSYEEVRPVGKFDAKERLAYETELEANHGYMRQNVERRILNPMGEDVEALTKVKDHITAQAAAHRARIDQIEHEVATGVVVEEFNDSLADLIDEGVVSPEVGTTYGKQLQLSAVRKLIGSYHQLINKGDKAAMKILEAFDPEEIKRLHLLRDSDYQERLAKSRKTDSSVAVATGEDFGEIKGTLTAFNESEDPAVNAARAQAADEKLAWHALDGKAEDYRNTKAAKRSEREDFNAERYEPFGGRIPNTEQRVRYSDVERLRERLAADGKLGDLERLDKIIAEVKKTNNIDKHIAARTELHKLLAEDPRLNAEAVENIVRQSYSRLSYEHPEYRSAYGNAVNRQTHASDLKKNEPKNILGIESAQRVASQGWARVGKMQAADFMNRLNKLLTDPVDWASIEGKRATGLRGFKAELDAQRGLYKHGLDEPYQKARDYEQGNDVFYSANDIVDEQGNWSPELFEENHDFFSRGQQLDAMEKAWEQAWSRYGGMGDMFDFTRMYNNTPEAFMTSDGGIAWDAVTDNLQVVKGTYTLEVKPDAFPVGSPEHDWLESIAHAVSNRADKKWRAERDKLAAAEDARVNAGSSTAVDVTKLHETTDINDDNYLRHAARHLASKYPDDFGTMSDKQIVEHFKSAYVYNEGIKKWVPAITIKGGEKVPYGSVKAQDWAKKSRRVKEENVTTYLTKEFEKQHGASIKEMDRKYGGMAGRWTKSSRERSEWSAYEYPLGIGKTEFDDTILKGSVEDWDTLFGTPGAPFRLVFDKEAKALSEVNSEMRKPIWQAQKDLKAAREQGDRTPEQIALIEDRLNEARTEYEAARRKAIESHRNAFLSLSKEDQLAAIKKTWDAPKTAKAKQAAGEVKDPDWSFNLAMAERERNTVRTARKDIRREIPKAKTNALISKTRGEAFEEIKAALATVRELKPELRTAAQDNALTAGKSKDMSEVRLKQAYDKEKQGTKALNKADSLFDKEVVVKPVQLMRNLSPEEAASAYRAALKERETMLAQKRAAARKEYEAQKGKMTQEAEEALVAEAKSLEAEMLRLKEERNGIDDQIAETKKKITESVEVYRERLKEQIGLDLIRATAEGPADPRGLMFRVMDMGVQIPGTRQLQEAMRRLGDGEIMKPFMQAYEKNFKSPLSQTPKEVRQQMARARANTAIIIEDHVVELRKTLGNIPKAERIKYWKMYLNGDQAGLVPLDIQRTFNEAFGPDIIQALNGMTMIGETRLTPNKIKQWLADGFSFDVNQPIHSIKDVYKAMQPKQIRIGRKGTKEYTPAEQAKIRENMRDPYHVAWNLRIAVEQAKASTALENAVKETFGIRRVAKQEGNEAQHHAIERMHDEMGWVALDRFAIKQYDPAAKKYVSKGDEYYFPPELAPEIDKMFDLLRPMEIGKAGRAMDSALRTWKAGSTLYKPGFYTKNMVGELMATWYAGRLSARSYKDAMKVINFMRKDDLDVAALKDQFPLQAHKMSKEQDGSAVMFTAKNGQKVTVQDIAVAYFDQGLRTGWFNTEFAREVSAMKKTASMPGVQGVRKAHDGLVGFAEGMEDYLRMGHFVEVIRAEGRFDAASVKKASDEIRKYHFDYSDFTEFERMKMLRLFPFYKWTRRAMPLFAEMLFTKPGKITAATRLTNAYSDESMNTTLTTDDINGGDSGFSPNYMGIVPAWVQDNMGFRLGGEDNGSGSGVYWNSPDPFKAIAGAYADPVNTAQMLLNPFATTGMSIADNFMKPNVWGESNLDQYADAKEEGTLDEKNPLGYAAKASLGDLMGLQPLTNFAWQKKFKDGENPTGYDWANLFGAGLYDVDSEHQKYAYQFGTADPTKYDRTKNSKASIRYLLGEE